MEEKNQEIKQVAKKVEDVSSPPTIDQALEEDFLIFRDRYQYQPIYFVPKRNEGFMVNKIFVVADTNDSPDKIIVSELPATNYKRLNVNEVEASYKLALDYHIAKLERELRNNDENK